ncbi:MAG: hypothetical protein KGZ80_02600 [Methylomonas sp.]|nr:hypothetical protein [Methylomonas sp.]PPD20953.1 MAG: hypothetical protein CTY23_06980 [Methylomonas sp.]PPD27199.1 MAG: hypothetical protein CTY22_02550 [Methylomonas sp.]PPD39149.1 MAG: hypothetical protein CTY21_02545 [Methylomonas sp.]PPD41308.1 MAG: hypothetical protein CTY17_04110 [Methylomonas sp.]
MNKFTMLAASRRLATPLIRIAAALFMLMMASTTGAALSQTPLFLTVWVDPNVLFNMSIETPMGGAAYADQPDGSECTSTSSPRGRVNDGGTVGVCYARGKTYLGYFDPDKCYVYTGSGAAGRFEPDGATINVNHECSGKFSGNFMNWATMTAIDMFTWTMTGGNRIVDTADNTTVIKRMRKHNNDDWFPDKLVRNRWNVSPSTVTPWNETSVFIRNTDFGVQFGTSRGGSNLGVGTYNVNIRVCNKNQTLEPNCKPYAAGDYFKPEGIVHRNAGHMRFGVTSYTNTSGNGIDGGVLRSNMKYVGTRRPDGSGGTQDNALKEINADGTLVLNANPADATASGVSQSGVIAYINRFSDAGYKGHDPASELFYESIRYFKNLGPTPEYLTGANGGFPILNAARWQDPMTASCQKNYIVGINDANPWMDKKLPGTHFMLSTFNGRNIAQDFGEPSNPDRDINVTALTNTVGRLEGINGTSRCIGCTATNCDMGAYNKHIPALGEVFGTCPATQKENSYYIAGLAYYANTQDIRSNIPGKQTVSTFMIDTQEFGTNPLVGQMNMLWLAGKYGGFNDINGNAVPNGRVTDAAGALITPSEWDADGDGEPDNYVLATRPDKLVQALNRAFVDIDKRTSSASAVAANSTRLDAGTQVYQARFNSSDWSGQLLAFTVNVATGELTGNWDAETRLPAHTARRIFTYRPQAAARSRGVEFLWNNLSKDSDVPAPTPQSQQHYLNRLSGVNDGRGADRVNWLRGDASLEQRNPGGIFRNRSLKLGDIINSDPMFIGNTDYGYGSLAGAEGSSYTTFRSSAAYTARRNMIYVGANDGMLHGFDASIGNDGGREILAYIPDALMPELSQLTSPNYSHRYYVDGPIGAGDAYDRTTTQWHTLLAGTLGAGGKALFMLDVSTPDTFGTTHPLWEYTSANDNDLGNTFAQPAIVRLENGQWVAIVGNGYESDNGRAVLYVFDAFTGAVLRKIDTGAGTVALKNGLSSPLAVDTDNDRSIDTVYAGDLYGNLWKFDVSGANVSDWGIAGGAPFFVACARPGPGTACAQSDRQPITSKPNVGNPGGVGTDQNGVGRMIYFGTGKYIHVSDNIVGTSPQVQTFYGLWDRGAPITDRAQLQDQRITFEGVAPTASNTSTMTTHPIRVVSNETVCYATTTPGCPAGSSLRSGWSMNLLPPSGIAEGERVVSHPLVRRGLVIFATLIPSADPCNFGGSSRLMELDALTGGFSALPPFDTNGTGTVNADDRVVINGQTVVASGIDLGIGIFKTPAVVESTSVDYKYLSGSAGDVGRVTDAGGGGTTTTPAPPTVPLGTRRSWLQLR